MAVPTNLQEPSDQSRDDALDAGLAVAFGAESAPFGLRDGVLAALQESLGELPRVLLGDVGVAAAASVKARPLADGGRYQLLGEIARGGMGVVLKGRDTDLGRDLAVKVLQDAHQQKPDIVRRFVEEAQIGGQLQRPFHTSAEASAPAANLSGGR